MKGVGEEATEEGAIPTVQARMLALETMRNCEDEDEDGSGWGPEADFEFVHMNDGGQLHSLHGGVGDKVKSWHAMETAFLGTTGKGNNGKIPWGLGREGITYIHCADQYE